MNTPDPALIEDLLKKTRAVGVAQRAALPRHSCTTPRMADQVERQFQECFLAGLDAALSDRIAAATAEVRKRLGLAPVA